MRKPSFISKAIAFLLAIGATILLAAALIASNLRGQLMAAEPYQQAFSEQGLYDQIPELAAAQVAESIADASGPAAYFSYLDEDDWASIMAAVMPPDWAEEQAEGIIADLFAFLNGETDVVETSLSLQELKAALNGPEGLEILEIFFNSLPPCTLDDLLASLATMFFQGEIELPVCAPPASFIDENIDVFHTQLIHLTEGIPDSVPISLGMEDFNYPDPRNPGEMGNLVEVYRQARWLFEMGPWFVAGLMVLIAVLVVRSWRELFRWWGWILLAGGGLVFVLVLRGGELSVRWLEDFLILRAPPALSLSLVEAFVGVAAKIVRETLLSTGTFAGMVLVIGFIMLLMDYLLGWREEPAAGSASG